ncbi:MAG TPA: hypothetical protein VFY36_01185 [Solirubrobacteraceae bacterium]|nr:hypothetical protein [Solirubrobacteraceae bacterium]
MVMFEQSRRLSEPLRWGRREKAAIAALLSCVAIALAALGVHAATNSSSARADCVKIEFASTLGGGELHACGGKARQVCAGGASSGEAAQLRDACRRAGFPFGNS